MDKLYNFEGIDKFLRYSVVNDSIIIIYSRKKHTYIPSIPSILVVVEYTKRTFQSLEMPV